MPGYFQSFSCSIQVGISELQSGEVQIIVPHFHHGFVLLVLPFNTFVEPGIGQAALGKAVFQMCLDSASAVVDSVHTNTFFCN